MDGLRDEVTLNEFKLFYRIDRELYIILVKDLCRDPSECLQIMGLWLWLECRGFSNFISKILSLAPFLINGLADEAVTCLKLVNNQFSISSKEGDVPLTSSLVRTYIPFLYFYNNRHTLYHNIQRLVSDVYIPVLSDILEMARHGGPGESSGQNLPSDESLAQSFSSLHIQSDATFASSDQSPRNESLSKTQRYARTMFATFYKGFPISETELRQYFQRRFGNCIDTIRMHETRLDEQALYAKIVFLSPAIIEIILNGETKVKFTINRKHVWIRQFMPRRGRMLPCGCLTLGSSICPHH